MLFRAVLIFEGVVDRLGERRTGFSNCSRGRGYSLRIEPGTSFIPDGLMPPQARRGIVRLDGALMVPAWWPSLAAREASGAPTGPHPRDTRSEADGNGKVKV